MWFCSSEINVRTGACSGVGPACRPACAAASRIRKSAGVPVAAKECARVGCAPPHHSILAPEPGQKTGSEAIPAPPIK